MLQEAIKKIVLKENLTEKEAYEVMGEIMSGNGTPSLIGGLLIGLRLKGESVEEITGFAKAMRDSAVKLQLDADYVIDTCGTGGDGGKTFNISTAVAIIASAAGVKVAKHGNRAVSSKSGSADVLKELGFNIETEPMYTKRMIEEKGMGFLFAPLYHRAMKNVLPIRRELGTRTVFNLLGPLTNPAPIKGQVLGVYDRNLTHPIAEVLLKLEIERAMVVHGFDGLDEITTTAPTYVSEVKEGEIFDYVIDPLDFDIPYARPEDLKGEGPKENAEIIIEILKGQKGPRRDIVVLNTAAALYVGKLVENLKEGVELAERLLDSGLAYERFLEILDYQRRIIS
ncbi:anthranilate phosphoribosyltransferase [Caldanaerobacter sp.]|uniref:anthranilate phosphoribosyltransferase n=1 Tax=Caldanaerobacter sp. TaxID=2930036 RepID=UPI003C72906E